MAGFESPLQLLFLLIIPLLVYLYWRILQQKKNEAMKFSHIAFVKSAMGDTSKQKRNHYLFGLSVLAIALMLLGFANPHIPLSQAKEGVNVVLVIDVSGSMSASDYKPTRIEAAKSAAGILIDSLKSKDQAGIVIFESGATTAAYLSPFKERVREKLRTIAQKEGRTALGDGLAMGVDMASSIPNKKNILVLLSDGVANAGVIPPAEAVAYAKQNKMQVYTVGVGTKEGTVMGYDFFGNPVYSDLDEETLKMIARETGGTYFKSVDSSTLDDIYKTISDDIKREREETNIASWFFIAALLVQLIALYARYGAKRILQ